MKKIWLFAFLILAAVIGVVLTSKPSPNSAAQSSTGVPPVMEPPRQAGRLPYTSAPAPAESTISGADQIAPFLSAPITLQDGGSKRPFELATDELYLRLPDGSQRVVTIPKATTPEAFAAAIEKARAEHGIEPELVLYPAGAPRNEFSRRIVTRDVVVNAPSRERADAMAQAKGLVFRKAPAFATNAFIYEAPTSAAALGVLTRQEVASADATPLLASLAAKKTMPNDPYVQLQWHLKHQNQQGAVAGTDINVESVWNYPAVSTGNYIRGGNVTIGIVDDGLEWSHPDLARNMRNDLNWDWNGKDNDPKPSPGDDHGTACAGVAAARGNNRIGVSGVAPEASLVGMRINLEVGTTDLDEAEAMTWKKDQIEIKSNSWGPSDDGYTLKAPDSLMAAALKYAADFGRDGKGSIITFAGGNGRANGDNSNYDGYANSIYTIAVAAMDSDGLQSWYSESGANLVVSAPSSGGPLGIMTTDNKGLYGYNPGFDSSDFASSGDVTKNFSGTSAACPVVSGVIALMLEKNPDLGWRDVQEILMRSATKIATLDLDWKTPIAPDNINHSHKYGAGLVNATAAVELAKNWTNLSPQKSLTVTTNNTTPISANATNVTRTFTVSGDELRVEHVTLRLTVEDIKKGALEITLTSPDGTVSVFCLEHNDQITSATDPTKGWADLNGDTIEDPEELFDPNEFENWTFMTVRNWGEGSNGVWTLTINNTSAYSGNLTDAELVVYGSDADAPINPPVVNLATSKTSVFVGSNFTLTATAKDKNNNSVQSLEAFQGGVSQGTSSNGTWQLQANAAGTFTFTVNATDGDGVVATSNAVQVEVLSPIAVWDFDATTYNTVPLASAVQSTKRYAANFGTGNMTFNGNFTDSNLWSHKAGEIWVGEGTGTNAVGEMNSESLNNKALMLRGGKNIGAEDKSIVFDFSTAGLNNVNVSYASYEDGDGFGTQTWSYSTNGTTWTNIGPETPIGTYSQLDLGAITALANKTTAYLKVVFTGATAAQGVNLIDNIIISADPITAPTITANFTRLNPALARLGGMPTASPDHSAGGVSSNHSNSAVTETSENLGWVLESADGHEMTVHAEVIDGSKFLNAPGSLLSANKNGTVSGLAEPIPQTTRYELPITSAEPNPAPMRLKVYDSTSKGILVLEEKVPFTPGATIGSPTTPKRYKVAYEEIEQRIPVVQGWNTFTTAVDPDPSTLSGVFAGYDFSEGDRLVGPDVEATVLEGKWTPPGIELAPEVTYSLLRQSRTASQFMLKGKALENTALKENQSTSHYGIWMNLPPGSVTTMDFVDYDTDGIDDRRQPGPGMPMPEQKSTAPTAISAPISTSAPAAASEAATQSTKQKKTFKKAKNTNSGKNKAGKNKAGKNK
jgi:subtilisin family serine protease